MGKIIRNGEEFGGSSNSAENIMYNETTNVKEAISETKDEVSALNSNLTWWMENGYLPDPNNPIIALVPTMTSDTTPSGQVIYSSYYSYVGEEQEAWKAFDSNNNTSWSSNDNTVPQYIGYKFASKKTVTRVDVTKRVYSVETTTMTCQLQGSNDGNSWTNIGDVFKHTTSKTTATTDTYTFDNSTPYMYYRIYISDNTSSSVHPTFSELQFYGKMFIETGKSGNTLTYNPDTDYFGITYNGEWKNVIFAGFQSHYLYANGNEFTEITGGWTTNGYTIHSAIPVSGSVSKQDNTIDLTVGTVATNGRCGIIVGTKNILDLSNYNALYISYIWNGEEFIDEIDISSLSSAYISVFLDHNNWNNGADSAVTAFANCSSVKELVHETNTGSVYRRKQPSASNLLTINIRKIWLE